MSDTITIARPYAKALFEHALSSGALSQWSSLLSMLAEVACNNEVVEFVSNPTTTAAQQAELFESVVKAKAGSEQTALSNFLLMLAENKRLLAIPAMAILFEVLREEHEQTMTVTVHSYSTLTSSQEQALINMLTNRLKRQVTLNITIDKTLLGGAIIQAGDLVIDGSVRGKLTKLGAGLAA